MADDKPNDGSKQHERRSSPEDDPKTGKSGKAGKGRKSRKARHKRSDALPETFSNYLPISSKGYVVGEAAGEFFLDSDRYGVPDIHVCHYNKDDCLTETMRCLPDPESLEKDGYVTWVMVNGFGDRGFAEQLIHDYLFHRLVVEDIADLDHPPKIDFFDDAIFLVLRMATDKGADTPVSIIVKGDLLYSFCPSGKFKYADQLLHRLQNKKGLIRDKGADYLLFCLLDIIVDSYFPKVDILTNRISAMDEEVFAQSDKEILLDIKKIRRKLNIYIDNISPLTDLIHRLTHHTACWIDSDNHTFYNDAADHVRHLRDRMKRLKEASSDIVILTTSITSQRMNEVMRMLTALSTIFMPLSFIVGLYGMNFDPDASIFNMPELKWKYGYPAVILLMLTIVASMLWLFRRRKWF